MEVYQHLGNAFYTQLGRFQVFQDSADLDLIFRKGTAWSIYVVYRRRHRRIIKKSLKTSYFS
ncbi:hypothetical protein COO91_04535 [Nostoc flagelliforme CCNUN1]|uniref:Uncharacterized protein n=1 Tax=Nostoc flagelliforme CCNUN1 TaxID=2038116 RepID=A0A2K8SUV6_9NOSO|nr:hypothetical protein COO91_04535 [Nostoc flagelliforme CCNUN1]